MISRQNYYKPNYNDYDDKISKRPPTTKAKYTTAKLIGYYYYTT